MSPMHRKLKALREARRWSLHTLAAQAGISHVALLKIERGEVSPRLNTAEALAAALGVPLAALLETKARPTRARR